MLGTTRVGIVIVAAGVLALATASPALADDGSSQSAITSAQALSGFQQIDPSAVMPSTDVGHGINPTMTVDGTGLTIDGSLADGSIQRDPSDGFALATDAGRLEVLPSGGQAQTQDARVVAGGDAALFDGPDGASVIRPTAIGLETYNEIVDASAQTTFSWKVSLPGDETLVRFSNGVVAILAPVDQTQPDATTATSVDPAAPAGGVAASEVPAGQRIVTMISSPQAQDANGMSVPSSLSVDGDTVTLQVTPDASTAYPVIADPLWIPEGDLGNGWWSYGADQPLANSVYFFENAPTSDGGCQYADAGVNGDDQATITRQLAIYKGTCLSLIETGSPYSAPDSVFLDAVTSGENAFAASAIPTGWHRNVATFKSDYEDPAQIDVNEVSDTVDWYHDGHCVHHPLSVHDHTHEYGLTGWGRTEHLFNSGIDAASCGAITASTYAVFKGGQYFPFCFGSKVTAIYDNNIAQGYPNGKLGGFVSHKLGGAPCRHLLHFETHRKNKRVA